MRAVLQIVYQYRVECAETKLLLIYATGYLNLDVTTYPESPAFFIVIRVVRVTDNCFIYQFIIYFVTPVVTSQRNKKFRQV